MKTTSLYTILFILRIVTTCVNILTRKFNINSIKSFILTSHIDDSGYSTICI